MAREKTEQLQEEYGKILKTYIETYDETCLFRIGQLAKQFLEEKVGPDEVAEMHSRQLSSLVRGMSRDQTVDAFQHAINPLLELMMGYAVAYQNYLDMQEKRFEEFKERGESVEFEKLASVGMLSLGMMERLGAMLESIVGTHKMMAMSGTNGNRKQLLDTLLQQVNMAIGTTKTLTVYSRRIVKEEPVEVDVGALLNESLEIVRRLVNLEQIAITTDIRDAPLLMSCPGELQEMFVSLIADSIDTMKGSGQLTLVCRYELSRPTNYHLVGIAYKAGEPRARNIFSLPPKGVSIGMDIARNIAHRRGAVLEIKTKGAATSITLKISPVDELDGVVMKL